ncbi:hypothetical protein PVAND_002639 [Polypedilum vanderplanki]|uniref:Uncharacterized protein n=1 Tax=Polypedilum vanderplanki TaxID=319348 RepID=A0A9J6BRL6_POLVA|nr:hypothetical protein PVAND_002639 [Polypedilum vanderplanki]
MKEEVQQKNQISGSSTGLFGTEFIFHASNSFSLDKRILSNTLPKHEINDIGLYSDGLDEGIFVLGIATILAFFH